MPLDDDQNDQRYFDGILMNGDDGDDEMMTRAQDVSLENFQKQTSHDGQSYLRSSY